MAGVSDTKVLAQAKKQREKLIEMLQVCTCSYPVLKYRNMSGHHGSCPAFGMSPRDD
jgi:hypothetical protein